MKKEHFLITGGTGLVGTRLTTFLQAQGHTVSYLSRKEGNMGEVQLFRWDIQKGWIDPKAFEKATVIVHLAGAGVADKRWTESYKQEIYDSRVKATMLLAQQLLQLPHMVHTFVGGSAIGIYGADTGAQWLDENSTIGKDFLATVVKDWEAASYTLTTIRKVILRIGIVLAKDGGALPKLALPVRLFVGAALASGRQYIPWIHLDDLCQMIIHLVQHSQYSGVFNAVAPAPVTNEEMNKEIGKVLHRPVFLPNVPSFVLAMALGEMAQSVVGGNRVKADKVLATNFSFMYPQLPAALKNLLL